MTERIGQKFGNYRLTHLLGEGGFASVYLAEHIHLHTEAAIKVLTARLSDQEVEPFRHEAYILARFHHPNIVHMLDFGLEEKEHLPFLVMQYASHGTLRQRHPEGSCVPLSYVRFYVKSVAAALQYAHDHHIVHRDVKPENMLIGDEDEILLSDFGVALLSQSTLNSLQQQTQDMGGTAHYMAPEQIQGKPRPASDQYALAVVAYEWLCGVRPFQGTFAEVCVQQIAGEPQPLRQRLPTLSSEVEQVVMKALAKDPKQRFESIQAFATAFEEAAEEEIGDVESVLATVPLEHMTASSEHAEEQKTAIAGRPGGSPRIESLRSTPPLRDDLTATQLSSPKSNLAATQLSSGPSGSPWLERQSSLRKGGDLATAQLSSPKEESVAAQPAFAKDDLAATQLSSERQARKRRSLLIGIVALTLLAALVGSTVFAILTLTNTPHNPTKAKAGSTVTAHLPTAKATAAPTATAQPPTATPTAPATVAQPTTAPVLSPVVSSADFTTQTPGLNNMTLVTNDAFFSNGHSILSGSQQVTVAFTLQPGVKTVTVSLTGLVSQNGPNVTGFSPVNIYCNNQVVASNFTMPGNGGTGIGPSTATFSISMQQLTQGSNQIRLVVASNAVTNFWLYNLSVTQSF